MTDQPLEGEEAQAPGGESGWRHRAILGAVCTLVIGLYAVAARTGPMDASSVQVAADSPYNLLVQGFRDGRLSLKKDVPAGLTQLAHPYDPLANEHYRNLPYRLHDLSYYKGRLYLYFGVTPALLLFWPFVALTGHYLAQSQAVMIFCALGFLVSVGLLRSVWRRYFSTIGFGVVIAGSLALGLGSGVLIMMARRAEVYEVAISCGYLLTMLTLAALWRAVHEPQQSGRWLVLASLFYGLAVGARPNLLFGAVILLVPIIQAWRERWAVGGAVKSFGQPNSQTPHPNPLPRRGEETGNGGNAPLSPPGKRVRVRGILLLAAMGPIVLIGLGLMLYNYQRFDSPLEFGLRYQLAAGRTVQESIFSLHYFWLNFRVYFLEPVHWNSHYPFAHANAAVPVPPGHAPVEIPYGILTNFPIVLLAMGVLLVGRGQARALSMFLTLVVLFFGISAATLIFFNTANFRYAIDFLPALMLLAVIGVLGLEHTMTGWPGWRRIARCGWGGLLGFSVMINLLASVEQFARTANDVGSVLVQMHRYPEAIDQLERALRTMPDFAEAHYNLGLALVQAGRTQEAMEQWEEALRIKPDYAKAHNNLGIVSLQAGRYQEAINHFKQALQSEPRLAEAHLNLGSALEGAGKIHEAVQQYEEALRLRPDLAAAQQSLTRLRAAR